MVISVGREGKQVSDNCFRFASAGYRGSTQVIPRETVLVDRREKTPDSCCFVSLRKHKQPSGGLPWGSSDWDSELPIQGAQVPSLMTGSTYCR